MHVYIVIDGLLNKHSTELTSAKDSKFEIFSVDIFHAVKIMRDGIKIISPIFGHH